MLVRHSHIDTFLQAAQVYLEKMKPQQQCSALP